MASDDAELSSITTALDELRRRITTLAERNAGSDDETMAQGLLLQDEKGVVVQCNPAAGSILEMSAADLVGGPFPDPAWGCIREDGTPAPPEEHPALVSLRTGQPVRQVVLGIPRRGSGEAEPAIRWLRLRISMPAPWHWAVRRRGWA